MTNNDIQNTTNKTKDWATRIQIKTGVNSGAPEGSAGSTPLVVPVVFSCYELCDNLSIVIIFDHVVMIAMMIEHLINTSFIYLLIH